MEKWNEYTSYEALSELGVEPAMIGEVLGAGSQTLAISPDSDYEYEMGLNNPVLIITKEKEKEVVQKAILGDKVKKLDSKKLRDGATFDFLKSEGWNAFYVEEMKQVNLHPSSSIVKAFSKFTDNNRSNKFTVKSDFSFIEGEIKKLISEFKQIRIVEESAEDLLTEKLIIAVKNALTGISKLELTKEFKLDLHAGQFVQYGEEIYCIDPVFFNFKK